MHTTNQSEIFILGLGYLGISLAKSLVEQGYKVKGIKRNQFIQNYGFDVEVTYLNLEDQLEEVNWSHYQYAKTWICLLPPSSSPKKYVKTIKIFMEKAIEFGINHVIYSSSISVYPNPGKFTESYKFSKEEIANSSIIQCEQYLINLQQLHIEKVPNLDIFRLGGLYSKDRHPVYHLNQRTKVTGQNYITNLCSKDQALNTLLFAIEHPNGLRIRNISQPHKQTRKEFYQQQALVLGVRPVDFDESDTSTGGRCVTTEFEDFSYIFNK